MGDSIGKEAQREIKWFLCHKNNPARSVICVYNNIIRDRQKKRKKLANPICEGKNSGQFLKESTLKHYRSTLKNDERQIKVFKRVIHYMALSGYFDKQPKIEPVMLSREALNNLPSLVVRFKTIDLAAKNRDYEAVCDALFGIVSDVNHFENEWREKQQESKLETAYQKVVSLEDFRGLH